MTTAGPLVSIITPSFNQGGYIAETIRSIREQTYPRIEHLVIDAGSSDQTLDVLEAAADKGHLQFVSEPDDGMYSAVNKGLRMAKGEILAYLNSDDLYLPWTVATAVGRLVGDPGVGFVFGDAFRYDDDTSCGRLVVTPPFRHEFVVRRGFLTQPTVFWKRELIDRHGDFDESLAYVGDCDYWMRIGADTKGVKIPEVLALERDHGSAKRFAAQEALGIELDAVRRRHGAPGSRLEAVFDRTYAYVWRLWSTLLCALRSAGILPAGRLPYKRGFGPIKFSVSRLLISLFPVLGHRLAWNGRVNHSDTAATKERR